MGNWGRQDNKKWFEYGEWLAGSEVGEWARVAPLWLSIRPYYPAGLYIASPWRSLSRELRRQMWQLELWTCLSSFLTCISLGDKIAFKDTSFFLKTNSLDMGTHIGLLPKEVRCTLMTVVQLMGDHLCRPLKRNPLHWKIPSGRFALATSLHKSTKMCSHLWDEFVITKWALALEMGISPSSDPSDEIHTAVYLPFGNGNCDWKVVYKLSFHFSHFNFF